MRKAWFIVTFLCLMLGTAATCGEEEIIVSVPVAVNICKGEVKVASFNNVKDFERWTRIETVRLCSYQETRRIWGGSNKIIRIIATWEPR